MINVAALKQIGTRTFGRGLLITKQFSPQILTTVGVVGVVTASVLGAKATLKVEPIVDKLTTDISTAKSLVAQEKLAPSDYTKYAAATYTHGVIDLVKLYGPAVSLGIASLGCIIGAHNILQRRNVALVAAYNVLEKSYGEYRKRVVEEFGEEKDLEYRSGMKDVIEKDEKGKDVVVTHVDPNGLSPYAKFFDEFTPHHSESAEYNLLFLKSQQNFANDILHSRGHIFLNEVYEMLGIEHTEAGSVVGWILSDDGDNFVDFGIYDFSSASGRNFVNGHEASVLLDFNVNGLIFDKIGKKF